LRKMEIKAGLFRPQTLWPFPEKHLRTISERAQRVMVVEMSAGQMVEDVERIIEGRIPLRFYGCMGGVIPMVEDIVSNAVDFTRIY
jgi:2-oxoglutarate ferredoxin oxidoreductase subunit alpha